MIFLQTNRLILRPLQGTDLEAFSAYRSDPEVARYQSWNVPFTPAQAEEFLERMESAPAGTPGVWLQLGVERRAEPGLIGDCAFQVLADDDRQARIGFTFGRAHQRQGYATEAVRRLLDFLFDDMRLHRVSAVCDARNAASARLMERIGMRREAHFLENIRFKGEWGSEYSYAMLEREWRAARGGTGQG
jgi:RimJ/RimL family protein N-acetyltransferase